MAYRPEWFPNEKILTIALDVVMYVRGSFEMMVEDHELNVRALEHVVKNWQPDTRRRPLEREAEFDEQVLNLVKIALGIEKDYQEIIKVMDDLKGKKNDKDFTITTYS